MYAVKMALNCLPNEIPLLYRPKCLTILCKVSATACFLADRTNGHTIGTVLRPSIVCL